MKTIALIIAGGRGARMGASIPKQFIKVYKKEIIAYTLEKFQNHPLVNDIYVVCVKGYNRLLLNIVGKYKITKFRGYVFGGKNGQDSIRNGIDFIKKHHDKNDIILVHDAIRPNTSEDVITDNIKKCKKYGNATTVIPCNAAMLKTLDGISAKNQIKRDYLKETQTPQAFYIRDLCASHKLALKKGITNSVASCTMYIELGKKVYLSKGSETNIKITTPEDIRIFKALLDQYNE